MFKEMEKLLNKDIENMSSNDLVYVGYLCDEIYTKCCKQYISNNSDDEDEEMFIAEEFQELVNNEHFNDCNMLF